MWFCTTFHFNTTFFNSSKTEFSKNLRGLKPPPRPPSPGFYGPVSIKQENSRLEEFFLATYHTYLPQSSQIRFLCLPFGQYLTRILFCYNFSFMSLFHDKNIVTSLHVWSDSLSKSRNAYIFFLRLTRYL